MTKIVVNIPSQTLEFDTEDEANKHLAERHSIQEMVFFALSHAEHDWEKVD